MKVSTSWAGELEVLAAASKWNLRVAIIRPGLETVSIGNGRRLCWLLLHAGHYQALLPSGKSSTDSTARSSHEKLVPKSFRLTPSSIAQARGWSIKGGGFDDACSLSSIAPSCIRSGALSRPRSAVGIGSTSMPLARASVASMGSHSRSMKRPASSCVVGHGFDVAHSVASRSVGARTIDDALSCLDRCGTGSHVAAPLCPRTPSRSSLVLKKPSRQAKYLHCEGAPRWKSIKYPELPSGCSSPSLTRPLSDENKKTGETRKGFFACTRVYSSHSLRSEEIGLAFCARILSLGRAPSVRGALATRSRSTILLVLRAELVRLAPLQQLLLIVGTFLLVLAFFMDRFLSVLASPATPNFRSTYSKSSLLSRSLFAARSVTSL